MSLGGKIRELRIAKGLTQSDLGSSCGVTPSMISQIESDKANPSYKVLEGIADKLVTPLEYFLSDVQTQMEKASAHKVAKALISSGTFLKAIELLRAIMKDPSPHTSVVDVRTDLATCYIGVGEYDQAVDELEQVIELAKNKPDVAAMIAALNKLGIIELHRKKHYYAIFHWRKAYELFQDLPTCQPFLQSEVLHNLGMVHQLVGEFEDVTTHFPCRGKGAVLSFSLSEKF